MKLTGIIGSFLSLGSLSLLCQVSAIAQNEVVNTNAVVVQTNVIVVQTNVIVVHTNVVVVQTNAYVPAPAPVPPPAPPPPKEEKEERDRFHAGELDLSGFGLYIDRAGGKWGGGAALTFYPIQDIGVGAATFMTDTKGVFFDNVEGELYLRLPLADLVAPYGVGSFGYQFDREYTFETVGLGVDFRPFRNLATFADGQWLVSNDHDKAKNSPFVRIGLRFAW